MNYFRTLFKEKGKTLCYVALVTGQGQGKGRNHYLSIVDKPYHANMRG